MTRIIVDYQDSRRRASVLLQKAGPSVDLDKIVFVGSEPHAGVISTLPSTFPHGEERYNIWSIVAQEKEHRGLIDICSQHGFSLSGARNFYYGYTPRSALSVQKAEEEGLLPYSSANSSIYGLHKLFSLSFWSGCLTEGWVQIISNIHNNIVLEELLHQEGYHNSAQQGEHRKRYTVTDGAHLLISAAAARTFALLGTPIQNGHKAHAAEFDLPWYIDFLCGNMFMAGQSFTASSAEKAQRLCQYFCYALLTNRSNGGHESPAVVIELPVLSKKSLSRRLVKKTSDMLMKAFPGLTLTEDNNLVFARENNFRSRIYLYPNDAEVILQQLEARTHFASIQLPPYLRMRSLACRALLL